MKKLLSLLLCLALCLSLAPAALADGAQVVVSSQKLCVNGTLADCERYNIDGSNYFKLRDLALLLNGTGSQFSVDYDEKARTMIVVTGEAYTPVGGELAIGADKSATAVVSRQTLTVNGVARSDLSAYNIGGNNYFKLRDLGAAVGFDVGYDEVSKTMLVFSAGYLDTGCWVRTAHETAMTYSDGREPYSARYEWTVADNGAVTEERLTGTWNETYSQTFGYDGKGNLSRIEFLNSGFAAQRVMQYDGRGTLLEDGRTYTYLYDGSGEIWSREVCTYDAQDRVLTRRIEGSYDDGVEVAYAYDAAGRLLREEVLQSSGKTVFAYAYDANGNCISETRTGEDGYDYTLVRTFDAAGNMLTLDYTDADGSSHRENTYDKNGNRLTDYYETDGLQTRTTNTYDSQGRMLSEVYEWDGEGRTEETWTYNERGDITEHCVTYPEGYTVRNVYEYQYDADGNMTRCRSSAEGEVFRVDEYSYNGFGCLVKAHTVNHYGVGEGAWTEDCTETWTWRFLPNAEAESNYGKAAPYLESADIW